MYQILIAGAGKIGTLIACLLEQSGDYRVAIADVNFQGTDISRLRKTHSQLESVTLDVANRIALREFLIKNPQNAIISSLPYYCNLAVAEIAKEFNCHYFDLTEDTTTAAAVKELAKNSHQAFVPQCGLAPGFVGIVANNLMHRFTSLDTVKLRVGALPVEVSNALHYALTWSTEGLINQYANLCPAIANHEKVLLQPLHAIETVEIDGLTYEAFNTSGGLGSLVEICEGKVRQLNYKTLRYPGHCEKMRFLMQDLRLADDRLTLKRILETAIPKTYDDVVVIYVSVSGYQNKDFMEENYVKKIYPQVIADIHWSAIQVATAGGVCAIVDLIMESPNIYRGLILQENFSLQKVLNNRFGIYYN